MIWDKKAFVFATFALGPALAFPLPGHAGPPAAPTTTVNANVVNTASHPVPVVITGATPPQPISFRAGFHVPAGKRLLIDDVTVSCIAIGSAPADFNTFGISVGTLLSIAYPVANCPEPLDLEGRCPLQLYAVGTGKQNGIDPIFLTAPPPDGRPAARLSAGRQISAVADQFATVSGICEGEEGNVPSASFTLRGTGRLVDRP